MLPLRRILCPVDMSEASYAALDRAAELASHYKAELYVLHVTPCLAPVPTDLVVISYDTHAVDVEHAENALNSLKDFLANRPGLPEKVTPLVKLGQAAEEIANVAVDKSVDLIVIATHGEGGWRHLVFGSVTEHVLHLVPCPVLVVRPDAEGAHPSLLPIRRILSPIDFSEPSLVALRLAGEVAAGSGAEIDLLYVIAAVYGEIGLNTYISSEDRVTDHQQLCEVIEQRIAAGVKANPILRQGDPADEIAQAATEAKTDLIIMSTHGLTGWRQLIYGSVTGDVLRKAPCPVLVVRATRPGEQ